MYLGSQVDVYKRMQNLRSSPSTRTEKLHPSIHSLTAYFQCYKPKKQPNQPTNVNVYDSLKKKLLLAERKCILVFFIQSPRCNLTAPYKTDR